MAVGIGGGGFIGVALEQLPAPVQAASATNAAGGTLAAGTYKYYVTAVNANGETTVSNEISQATTGATSTVTVNWAAVVGATHYKIYRTAAGGATGTQLLLTTVASPTITFIDTGALVPAGAFPTVNTANAPNVYRAPVKFFPITSESLQYNQETQWRRPIRQNVDNLGGVPGNVHIEGDIEMELLTDAAIYFHRCSRAALVKTGSSNPYTYTYTPLPSATAGKTMSITVVRNGEVFGYVGCVTSSFGYTIDAGQLKATYSILGSDEASQSLPVPTFSNQLQPFGAGEYTIEVPTATQVYDMDTFEFQVEDNAEAQFRLKNNGRGAEFIKFGERNVTLSVERDFHNRTDYDSYKALTSQGITLKAAKTTGEEATFTIASAIKESYELGLSSQGDLVRGSISYQGIWNAAAQGAYELVFKANENMAA